MVRGTDWRWNDQDGDYIILLCAIVYVIVSLVNTCLLILEAGAFSWNISISETLPYL